MVVGSRVHARRVELGLSRAVLAKRINVTQQQLSRYERGHDGISVSRLLVLAEALSVQADFFFQDLALDSVEPASKSKVEAFAELSQMMRDLLTKEARSGLAAFLRAL